MAQTRCISCMNTIDSPVCPYCGHPVQQNNLAHQLPVGTMLRSRYQVGRVLGQGGFGITYTAWDTLMENVVAVKEFYPSNSVNRNTAYSPTVHCNTTMMAGHYEASKARFLREAKALVRFRTIPEVVDILDFMEENNTAYIVMEFVRGVDLAKYIQGRGGRLNVEETFRILKPVMKALATVHKEGIVHRDISPDNIILDPMGGAKLLDFGAVRTVEDPSVDKALNKSTEAILKHGFAPLEQYNSRGSLGPWTDEYAMCATVFYCLTGRIPEEASLRVTEGIDPDWDSIEGLSPHQKLALAKGMAVRAKDRYPSMDALMEALFQEPAAQPAPQLAPQPMTVYEQKTAPTFEATIAIGQLEPPAQPPVRPATPTVQTAPKDKKKKKWGIFAAIAAILVMAILAGLLLPGLLAGSSEPAPQVSEQDAEGSSKPKNDSLGSLPSKKDENIRIAVVLGTLASEYYDLINQGCKQAAADMGIEITVVAPGSMADIEPQVAMIEQQIGAGCDAIICDPNDPGAAAAALQAAVDRGIPVIAVNRNIGMPGQTCFIGTMNDLAAREAGLWAAGLVGPGANAVIIYGQEGDPTSNLRRAGYEAACAEAGLSILAALSCQNTTDGATRAMEDMITAFAGDIDVVFCFNDDAAIGAMNACKYAGITDIIIVGFDGTRSTVELIQYGDLIKATVAQQPYIMGYEAVMAAVAAVRGEKVDQVISAAVKVITIENAQEYLEYLDQH